MRTLVVSDLHLGSRTGVDVLRRPEALDALCARLGDVDRLVILGDALELRHGPPREALAVAAPALRAMGDALREREVILVPGNHDHRLVATWLEARGFDPPGPPPPLALDERAGTAASPTTARVAELLAPARLDVAYPGLWLRDDVYATHGHYLDRHTTVPSFERLAAGALARFLGSPPEAATRPDDYELVLAPLYALLDSIADQAGDGRGAAPHNASSRAWELLSSDGRRPWHGRLLAGAFPLGVGALNKAGIGPLRPELSGEELRRAGLRAMTDVVVRLGLRAPHVIFGHTHRAGPMPGDDLGEWTLPSGGRLLNTGCWVYEPMYLARAGGESPYWPGSAALVEDDAPPRHLRLLADVPARALRPPEGPRQA